MAVVLDMDDALQLRFAGSLAGDAVSLAGEHSDADLPVGRLTVGDDGLLDVPEAEVAQQSGVEVRDECDSGKMVRISMGPI